MVERLQCDSSKKVKYSFRSDYMLPLQIPREAAVNADEVREYEEKVQAIEATGAKVNASELPLVRPRIPFEGKLEISIAAEVPLLPNIRTAATYWALYPFMFSFSHFLVSFPNSPSTACLKCFIEPELIEGFYSSALKSTTTATKTTKLVTFPDYLVVQVHGMGQ